MTPRTIFEEAVKKNLDIVAISDHNSCENLLAAFEIAKDYSISFFPGIEVSSREEVHVLGIFERLEDAMNMQKFVYDHLFGVNDEDLFGYQVIVNEKDRPIRFCKKLLIGATDLSVDEVVENIHRFFGIAIAAHIDRDAFSLISQLGFIPEDIPFDAFELSHRCTPREARKLFGDQRRPYIRSSDAHFPEDIGKCYTEFLISSPTLSEIKKAFSGIDGRRIEEG